MQNVDVAQQLAVLNSELSALWVLSHRLSQQVRETLVQIKSPTNESARTIALDYLRAATNAQLRRDLREARGERSASCLSTKMRHDLEARHVNGNNNGAAL